MLMQTRQVVPVIISFRKIETSSNIQLNLVTDSVSKLTNVLCKAMQFNLKFANNSICYANQIFNNDVHVFYAADLLTLLSDSYPIFGYGHIT